MKIPYIKALAALTLGACLTGCGDKFLETDIPNGVDDGMALNTVKNIGYALNGTYYAFYYYSFAGTESVVLGDLGTDLPYWNAKSQHFNDIYQYSVTSTSTILGDIWEYGYKVADNAARVIEGADALRPSVTDEDEKAELDRYEAEAYALRAYSQLALTNIFAHQIKVNGSDFSSMPGIVVIDKPVMPYQNVKRSTVGESYAAVVSDLKKSLEYFDAAGHDAGTIFYVSPKAVYGLLARTYLYMENYADAAAAAKKALDLAGITELTYTEEGYKALYNGGASNVESLFALDINSTQNWSAKSIGTLWSTYGYSPSPWLQSVMADGDVRRAVWGWTDTSTQDVPYFNSGKFGAFGLGGNPAYGTNYLVNAPEMFLIQAEAALKQHDVPGAQAALLTVAKRNPVYQSASDLPASEADLMEFLKEERARELFQEGHRLYDLRRWDVKADVYASSPSSVTWMISGYDISDLVYPIPDDEINAGYGVTQNEGWASTLPKVK